MARPKGGSCAVAVALLLCVGCSTPGFFGASFLQGLGPGQERVVAGSLESVTQSTQGTLRELGLAAVVTSQGEAVRIESMTPAGNRFALVLTRVKNGQVESTRVHIDWEKGNDQQTGSRIFAQLDAQSRR